MIRLFLLGTIVILVLPFVTLPVSSLRSEAIVEGVESSPSNRVSSRWAAWCYGSIIDADLLKPLTCQNIEKCSRNSEESGCYSITFSIDQNYSKITLKWYELRGYSIKTGRYKGQKLLNETSLKDFRRHPDPDHIYSIEVSFKNLSNGIYRVSLRGDTAEGRNNNLCELVRRFDGQFHPVWITSRYQ